MKFYIYYSYLYMDANYHSFLMVNSEEDVLAHHKELLKGGYVDLVYRVVCGEERKIISEYKLTTSENFT